MGHSIFGWDLPPGCSISDIPGNRPEDGRAEAIEEGFWDGKHVKDEIYQKFEKAKLDSDLMTIVWDAIEYGMKIGGDEALENYKCDQAMYKDYINTKRIPKLIAYFKALRVKAKQSDSKFGSIS